MKFSNTITIDCPQSAVFAYLAEFENIPRWNYAIAQTRKITDGPVGVGTRYRQTRTLPRRIDETFEVVVFEPEHALAIRGDLGPFHGDITYVLDSAGGATKLTNTVDLRASGPSKVLAPLASSQIKNAVAANLDVLRQILEQGN
ncbi:MAG TPA: SRPBCC family protein [Jiangellaceae bacterium]|nr:SRPBCC family protein [Jiangellaceae bacterium]